MNEISNAAASAAILKACDGKALTQRKWHGKAEDGREIACLLGSIDPSVRSAEDCNGALMPRWLAELTVELFDGIDTDQVYPIAHRYGELVGRWHTLSPARWNAILTRVLIRCIDVAVEAARPVSEGKPYWPRVADACERVKKALAINDPIELTAEAAREAAEAEAEAAWAASRAVAAARAAAEAAWAARAARAAARAAAEAAWAAWAARAAAARAARAAARAAAYLSLFTFLLDQIEAACVEAGE